MRYALAGFERSTAIVFARTKAFCCAGEVGKEIRFMLKWIGLADILAGDVGMLRSF